MKAPLWLSVAACAALAANLASAQPPSDAASAPDHVVIVLDASGSMKEPMPGTRLDKMSAAKLALKQVLQHIPSTTRLGLLVFSANGVTDHWVYPLGPRDDAALTRAIDRLSPHGGTPLGRYLKLGADRLLAERTKLLNYGSYRLLVVTDGEAQDRDLVDRFTPEIMARGITVDVIGVAMDQRHTLATKVHSYRDAHNPEALARALVEVFAEVGSGGQDTPDTDAFAALAPIPDAVAATLLQALAVPVNRPIGERAPDAAGTSAPAPSSPGARPSPSRPAAPPPPTQPPPDTRRGFTFGSIMPVVILLIIVSAVFRRFRR